MPSRWRCPPENSSGKRPAASPRRPTRASSAAACSPRSVADSASKFSSGSVTIWRRCQPGIERGVGVLEHHLRVPPRRAHRLGAEGRDIGAVDHDAPAARLQQPQHQPRHGRFAAAGLADQAQRLAACHAERDAIDGAQLRRATIAGSRAAPESASASRGHRATGAVTPRAPLRASTPRGGRTSSTRSGGASSRQRGMREGAARREGCSRRSARAGSAPCPGSPRAAAARAVARRGMECNRPARVGMRRPVEQRRARRPPPPCGRRTSPPPAGRSARPRRGRA